MKVFRKDTKDEKALKYFNGAYFWDYEKEKIKLKQNYQIIIERVLAKSVNNKRDYDNLEKFYTVFIIKKLAVDSFEIYGNDYIEFLAEKYNLKAESFKNYIPKNIYESSIK